MFRHILSFTFIAILSFGVTCQDVIFIKNKSFEDIPRRGDQDNYLTLSGWSDCGTRLFPNESPPDVHPNNIWDVNSRPSDGHTYLGLVVRDNQTYEGLSQRLPNRIEADKCYTLNIDLARSKYYQSHSSLNRKLSVNYVKPTVMRIWGGAGFCDERELLAESIPISHSSWKTYAFNFKPKKSHQYITIQAYYKTPVIKPYCGHILLDNLSNIIVKSCDEKKEKEIVKITPTKPKNSKLPPHKAVRQKTEEYATPEKPKKKKVLEGLDINKIKKGTTLEIKNLYFAANASDIDKSSYEVLDEIFEFLILYPNVRLEIGGHTNGMPKHDFCDKLSTARAKAVHDYLIKKGISEETLEYKGYGKRRRIAPDTTAEGRSKNQRVEIKVLGFG